MDPTRPDPEVDLNAAEARLRQFRPAPAAIDRDRLLFDAGRASAGADWRRSALTTVAAASLLVAAGLGGLLVRERAERRALEQALASRPPVDSPRPTTPPDRPGPPRPVAPDSYLALTRQLVAGRAFAGPPAADPAGPEPSRAPLRARGPGGRLDL